ncbi:MAG TPA: FAD-binding and (Fe-S)-binding domain-containing protein [Anaeromyxobacteraceae bacterium]|nr:FAD-binding and (Fe-S)-binding domain-containing protein [Anaeromyxobacteraceae bacterium]
MTTRADRAALPQAYRELHDELARSLPPERLVTDPLRTLAYGTDASFYRLVPKVVVQVRSAEEVADVLRAASRQGLGCTFRAAGTSLSGQAVSDSVLVQVAGGFRRAQVLDGGQRIVLEPGVIGAEANALLAPYGRKIGPDPASIGAAMVGGIAANNASGMCCGTAQNSYRTVESLKLVMADGTRLDTASAESRAAFALRWGDLLRGLGAIRAEILADPALSARIREKYRVKNTTGYGLNSFVDFDDPFDILSHLLIGSEGTLAFIAEITYATVEEHAHKASALVLFPTLGDAAHATQRLRTGQVAAVELMDRRSLRAVEGRPGLPPVLKTLPEAACALLVEVRAASPEALVRRIEEAQALVAGVPTLGPVHFTAVKAEYEVLWDVRRGLFPAVGASRRLGTTVVIEDVAFPMQHLADGVLALQDLLLEHGYDEGIIFGHALDGNVHFVFTQDFGPDAEVARYRRFMEAVCALVVDRFDGALKAEHGTGRNVAPFVEREWGRAAYALMRRVKRLFDPAGILNPGVILNDDPDCFVKQLKPLPPAHALVDRCIECGFCEPKCASRHLTLSPRQRIAVRRQVARLRASGEEPERLARLEADYQYQGLDTCAADGLCATACPVSIDTGKLTKALRAEQRGPLARGVAAAVSAHYGGAVEAARAGFGAASALHGVLGDQVLGGLASTLHGASSGLVPLWSPHLPRPARTGPLEDVVKGRDRQVIYFPACITRTWGAARGAADHRGVTAAMLSILEKAGYDVLFPRQLASLCCGLTLESKGFPELADQKCAELEAELKERSEGGRIPVLCDTSPCIQRMRAKFDPALRIWEPAEFIHEFLMDRLRFEKKAGSVAVHVTCSTQKLGLGARLQAVAEACAERVVVPPAGCCAFAGDLGLKVPELNAHALSGLRERVQGCEAGYSNSRGCEIGLSQHGGIPYQSIVYLVDRCTAPAAVEVSP